MSPKQNREVKHRKRTPEETDGELEKDGGGEDGKGTGTLRGSRETAGCRQWEGRPATGRHDRQERGVRRPDVGCGATPRADLPLSQSTQRGELEYREGGERTRFR